MGTTLKVFLSFEPKMASFQQTSDTLPLTLYLVNIDGETIHGIHITVLSLPSGSASGLIVYETTPVGQFPGQRCDVISIRFSEHATKENLIFDALPANKNWSDCKPNDIFLIKALIEDGDFGLDVDFGSDNFVASFRVDPDYDLESDDSDLPSKRSLMGVTDLITVDC